MKIYLVTSQKEWVKPVQESGFGMLFSYYDTSGTKKMLSMIREDKQNGKMKPMKTKTKIKKKEEKP
jgi:hypothetical protein